jgi:hypothetical protein
MHVGADDDWGWIQSMQVKKLKTARTGYENNMECYRALSLVLVPRRDYCLPCYKDPRGTAWYIRLLVLHPSRLFFFLQLIIE